MCTNVANLRRRLREEEGGSGDGSRVVDNDDHDYDFTILFEMGDGGLLTGQYPVLVRVAVSSVFVVILLLLSQQFAWASFLFDIAKPVYIVYIGGIAVVDLFAPALKKLDGWLGVQVGQPEDNEEETEDQSEVFSESMTPEELNSSMRDEDKDNIINSPTGHVFPTWEDDNGNNNLEPTTSDINDSATNCLSDEHNNRKNTFIPVPTNQVRKVRTRGRPGRGELHLTSFRINKLCLCLVFKIHFYVITDTDVELLRTLERELRKERERSSSLSQSREVIGRTSKIPYISKN